MSILEQLINAGRKLVDLGLSPGSSGNLSAREGDRILVTGTGASLGQLSASDFAEVSLDGEHLGGARASKETPLHVGFYQRSEEHRSVIHLHSPQAVAQSCREPWAAHNAIPPLTPYYVMRVGQTPLLPYRHPGDAALGEDLRSAPWPLQAALLANHGSVVAGRDLDEAIDRAVEVEEACRIALLTERHDRRELTPVQILELATRWKSPWSGTTVE
ncbi:class II aldolase/adducin family protein [Glutamicibacter sp. MNS18]|uniref:class II aldolase/adducin family protein n=1 Tax=Glutamicibacter sp. MNS18 TaxID=2989817 RepID=UPI002235CD05|nr:class II aldolase/adducin family protein [Glutamicibacter sp. MNS18]MCW4465403.1 class II aldolase/adducin family protein [Glutamicibacter sp. MNS18]